MILGLKLCLITTILMIQNLKNFVDKLYTLYPERNAFPNFCLTRSITLEGRKDLLPLLKDWKRAKT